MTGHHTIMQLVLPTRPLETIAPGHLTPVEAFLPDIALRVQVSGKCHAHGLSTGTATFLPGAELPYHTHDFSEAITVLSGEARVAVCGRVYLLARYDSIHIPRIASAERDGIAALEILRKRILIPRAGR